jgi:flagellar basal body-associated protein FliL
LEEVEGAAAIRRLQREIQDGFNAILAETGDAKVDAVLFEEFNIQ